MSVKPRVRSSERLREASTEAMEHYGKMRASIVSSGKLAPDIMEIILMAQFAVLGHEIPFKIHASRALDHGAIKDALIGVLMIGLGATLVAFEVARSLSWLDEVCVERAGS